MSLDLTLPEKKKASLEANQLKRQIPDMQSKLSQRQAILEEVKASLEEFNHMESLVNAAKKNIYLLLKNKMVSVEGSGEFTSYIEAIIEQMEQKAKTK